MVQATDETLTVLRKFKEELSRSIAVDELILFGSRTSGAHHEYSDFDVLVVSSSFRGIPRHRRAIPCYLTWPGQYPLEVLCYTPEEMERRKSQPGIVSEALRTGVRI